MTETQRIVCEVLSLEKKTQEEINRHQMTLSHLAECLARVRNSCPHTLTTRFDGSGNNDSWEQCELCGADVAKARKA